MTQQNIARSKKRARAIDFLGGRCSVCGSTDRLQFDHINNDRVSRTRCISQMLNNSWGLLVSELNKCQLLCVKCHVQKSILEQGYNPPKHGTLSMYNNYKCRCNDCVSANRNYARTYYDKRYRTT